MEQSEVLAKTLRTWFEASMRRSMVDFIKFSRETGLSMPQLGTLSRIMHKGTMGVSIIGEEMGVTSAAASQMLDRLVQQGIIQRSEDPNDRRLKQISLTDKGRKILQAGFQARQRWVDDLVASITPEEQDIVVAAMNILIEKTEKIGQRDELAEELPCTKSS